MTTVEKNSNAKRKKPAAAADGLPDSGGAVVAGIPAQIELRGIETLVPYARNSRTHSDAQIAELAASIDEFGLVGGIVVRDGVIAKGHGTIQGCIKLLKAGKSLYPAPGRSGGARPYPDGQIPVIDASGWSDAQFRAFVIADNKLALNADWNYEMLAVELDDLRDMDFDLGLLGFDQAELNEMIGTAATGPEHVEGEDDAPEPPENPVTVAGDVWLLGKHRLMCGDSTSIDAVETLMSGAKADFCFTSPPYNAARGKGHKSDRLGGNGFYGDGYTDNRDSDEYIDFNRGIFSAMSIVAADNFTCCYNINYNKNSPSEYLDVAIAGREFFPLVETIGCEKQMAVSLQGNNLTRIFEFIFVYAKGEFVMNKGKTDCERNLWKINNIGANHDIHKACFPVELAERGVGLFAKPGGVVFEPFGGSGTTMIAAEKLGRSARLMELDPRYCDVIVRRWQEFTGEQATLECDGRTFEQIADERVGATD